MNIPLFRCLVLSLASILVLAASGGAAEARRPFAAVIRELDTNRGIPDARVELTRVKPVKPRLKLTLAADAAGKVQASLPDGNYRYRVRGSGFVEDEGQLDLPLADPSTPMLLGLYRQAEVAGRLLDGKGKPVPGLRVALGNQTAVSDPAGSFRITGLPRGYHQILLKNTTLVLAQPVRFELAPGERRNLGDLGLRPGGVVSVIAVGKEEGREQPLPELRLNLSGDHDYRQGKSDAAGGLVFEPVAPGTYRLNCYDDRVLSISPSEVQVREEERSEVRVEAVMRPPEISLDDFGDVLLPGKEVKVRLNGFRVSKARVILSSIDPGLLAGGGIDPENRPALAAVQRKKIRTFEVPLKGNRKNQHSRGSLRLPQLQPGAYLLEVEELGAGRDGAKSVVGSRQRRNGTALPFLVTRLALVTKNSPATTLIYACDLESGKPLPGIEVKVFPPNSRGEGNELFRVETASDGLARVALPPGGARMVGRWGGSYARLSVTPEQTLRASARKGYVYTERPVYRPGQTVFFKGILRRTDGEGYRLPQTDRVRVKVTDSNDQSVLEREVDVSGSGSFHGEFDLSKTPALGGYSIVASSGEEQWQASFKVLEYRKPEFEVTANAAKKFVLAGDKVDVAVRAAYYFGAPVAGATVKYRLYSRQVYGYDAEDDGENDDNGDGGYYGGYADFIGEGELKSDADGKLLIPVETRPTRFPLSYTLELDVTDASSRQVSASTSFTVVPALIDVRVKPQSFLVGPGKPVAMDLRAATWDGNPVKAGFRVRIEEQVYDKKSRVSTFRQVDTLEASTDATGSGEFRYTFPRPGDWRVSATTVDSRGREATGQGWVWVWAEGYAWESAWRELGLVFDKKIYKPGETARLLVKNPARSGHLLLSVEGREVYNQRVVPLKSGIEVIELPLPKEYAPLVYVSASLVNGGRFYSRTRVLKLDAKPQLLEIAVAPDKKVYSPGERVRLNLTASGADGGGRAAELSLGVVDEAIYAIARERGDDLYTFFRGSRDHLVTTIHSFPRVYLGGAAKDEANAADEQPANRIRRIFKDTAFWLPDLKTGPDGKAAAEFDLPDNLTTWRATAIGHTSDSEFGTGRAKFISRLDVMARLLPPRFLVQGDEARIPTLINNVTESEQQVTGNFKASGLRILGDPSFVGAIPAGGSLRRDLGVRAETAGEALIRVDASAGARGDAMELPLPVIPRGIRRQARGNILLREGGSAAAELEFPAQALADGAELRVDFAPSLAASLNQGIAELVEFPYGCVEQTMSRFLPAVYVRQLAQGGNWPVDGEVGEKLPQVLESGLNRLYDFQHEDGGWGWWKEDATDVRMTAYVVYGLSLAKGAGVTLKVGVLERGMNSLATLVGQGAAGRLPYAYRALTLAGKGDPQVEERIEKQWQELPPSERMLYIAALLNRGERERAKRLLDEIRGSVEREGEIAWLRDRDADSWWYSERWGGSAVETTAMLLESVLQVDKNDPLAPALAEFLLRRRSGRWWQTTRATAMVIKALADYSGETGNYDARLLLNGKELERLKVEGGQVTAGRSRLAIPASGLKRGANLLQLEKIGGGGAAHLSAQLDFVVPPEMALSSAELGLERQLYRIRSRADGNAWRLERTPLKPEEKLSPGDEVEVRLVIVNQKEMEYVIVEDPLPAGFEVRETGGDARFADYGNYEDWYAHRERHDQKMAFFMDSLSPGRHEFRYIVTPQVEGKMLALPAAIWAMYQPARRAESKPWKVTVAK